MKKISLLLSLLLLFCLDSQAQSPKDVRSKIKNVTVFLKGAQVKRTAQVQIASGNHQLKFSGIPASINPASIQVSGDGNFTILSVTHQLNFLDAQQKNIVVDRLLQEKEVLSEQLEEKKGQFAAYQHEEKLLKDNTDLGGGMVGIDIETLRNAADFYRSRFQEIMLKQLEIKQLQEQLEKNIAKIDQQIRVESGKEHEPSSEILVAISSKSATKANFTLRYLVEEAGWFPNYDLRVKDINHPIDLAYKAKVYQNSGEDWDKVKLTIATSNPAEGGNRPISQPIYLSFHQNRQNNQWLQPTLYDSNTNAVSGRVTDTYGEGVSGVNVIVKGSTVGAVSNLDGYYQIALPAGATNLVFSSIGYNSREITISGGQMNTVLQEDETELSEVVVTGLAGQVPGVSHKKSRNKFMIRGATTLPVETTQVQYQTYAEFQIETPYDIPSNGKHYTVEMKSHQLAADYQYYCAPALDPDAFLTAKITGWEKLSLLAGETQLFFEGRYLGKSVLDPKNFDDTLQISLGRDKNIAIKREKQEDYSSKQLIGSQQKESLAWAITIRNNKAQPINLIVEEHIPRSSTKEINVEALETGRANFDDDTGKLTWNLDLQPNQNQALEYKYLIKYPKYQRLALP